MKYSFLPSIGYYGVRVTGYHPISNTEFFSFDKICSEKEVKNEEGNLIFIKLSDYNLDDFTK